MIRERVNADMGKDEAVARTRWGWEPYSPSKAKWVKDRPED